MDSCDHKFVDSPVCLRCGLAPWRIIGWFSANPMDALSTPESFTLTVWAKDKSQASDLGYRELWKQARGRQLLNWYTQSNLHGPVV